MENKFDKTSLDQAIESNQSTAPSIDIMQSYAPVEELFNTPEYDAYIDNADMSELQKLEEGSKAIESYGISALANLNKSRPTLATGTFDPVLQQNPPNPDEPGGLQRMIKLELDRNQSIENSGLPEGSVSFNAPQVSGIAQSNFMRYYEHPEFKNLGFSPYANNEAYYNANSTVWDDMSRMSGQFSSLVGTGFKSAYRNLSDPFGPDLKSAAEFEEAMAIGNSTRSGGLAWTNNLLLNSGYTFGIIGSIALEEVILAGATALSGGTLGGVAAVKTSMNIAKLGKTILNSFGVTRMAGATRNLLRATNNVDTAKDLYNGFSSGAKFVGKILAPETVAAIRSFKTTKNGAQNIGNLAKMSKTFGGFYKDLRSVNFALAESSLEAGMVYNQRISENLAMQSQENFGREITSEQMAGIEENASRASMATLMANAPLIFLSNQLVLGNAFGGFSKSFARMANNKVTGIGRRIIQKGKGVGKDGKKLLDVFEDAGTGFKGLLNRVSSAGIKGNTRKLAGASLRYFSANLAEGFQEISQEAISAGANDYYRNVFADPMAGGYDLYKESVNSAVSEQFSAQGFDVFMSGFLMGGVVSGPQKLFFQGIPSVYRAAKGKYGSAEAKAAYAQQNEAQEEWVKAVVTSYNKAWNMQAEDPSQLWDPAKLNFLIQKQVAGEMTESAYKNDQFGFIDAKDFAKFQQIYTVLSTGGAEVFENQLRDYALLSDEELIDAGFASEKEVKSGKARERFQSMINQIQKTENDYNDRKDEFPNPYDKQAFKKGTREYQQEAIKEASWAHANYLYMFTKDGFNRALERSNSIFETLASDPLFEKMAASDITVLLDNDSIDEEIGNLQAELSVLTNDTVANKKLVKDKTDKKERLEALSVILNDPKNLNKDGSFNKSKVSNKLLPEFEKYVKYLANSNGTFANKEAIKETLKKIVDHKALEGRAKVYDKTIEYLSNPERFNEIIERQNQVFTNAFDTMADDFKKVIEEYAEVNKKNELLNQIANLDSGGVVIPPENAKAFLATGSTLFLNEFYNSNGQITERINPLLYAELQGLLEVYNETTKKEAEKTQQENITKAEAELEKANRDEVNAALEELGITEDITPSSSKKYKSLLLDLYKKYQAQQLNKKTLAYPEWVNTASAKNFRNAFNALRSIWIANDLTINPNNSLTEEQKLDDNRFISWLLSDEGLQNNLVADVLKKLEIPLSDITGQTSAMEAEGESFQGSNTKNVFQPGINYSIIREVTYPEGVSDGVETYTIIDSKTKEEVPLEILEQYGETMGLFTDSDSAIKVLNKLEEDFGNAGEFLFDGEVLNTGGLVYKKDKDGNLIEYKILSKPNKILSGRDLTLIPNDKSDLSFKDKKEFLVYVKPGQFKGFYNLEKIDMEILADDVSRLDISEPVLPYPYRNKNDKGQNDNSIETYQEAQDRYKTIISALTQEEIKELQLVISLNPNAGKSNGLYAYPGSQPNKYIQEVQSKYNIGLVAGNAKVQNKINLALEIAGINKSNDPDGIFAFIGVQNFKFEVDGVNINPSNFTLDQANNLIRLPEYLKDQLTPEQALTIIKHNFAINQVLTNEIDNITDISEDSLEVWRMSLSTFSNDISLNLQLGVTDYDNNSLRSLNDLDYNRVDEAGNYLIYKLESGLEGQPRTITAVTNLEGKERIALTKKVKEALTKQGIYDDLQNGSDAYMAVVLLPNGTYSYVNLSATPLDFNELMVKTIAQAQAVIAQLPAGKDTRLPTGSKELKALRKWSSENTSNQQLFIKNNKGVNISLQISPWGKIELQVKLNGKKLQTIRLDKKTILDTKLENPEKIQILLDKFNEDQVLENQKISLKPSQFTQSFPRDASIAQLLSLTSTNVIKSVTSPSRMQLFADPSITQAAENLSQNTSAVFVQTEPFSDAEGNAIPVGPELTTASTKSEDIITAENADDSILDLSDAEFEAMAELKFSTLPKEQLDHIVNKIVRDGNTSALTPRELIIQEVLSSTIATLVVLEGGVETVNQATKVINSPLADIKAKIKLLKAELQKGKTRKEQSKALRESKEYQSLLAKKAEIMSTANKVMAPMSITDVEDINTFLAWANKNLPDFISIEDIATLGDNLKAGGERVGAFVLNLNDIAGGKTVNGTLYTGANSPFRYHEAFHGVFRMLLTDAEINKYLGIAKKEVKAKLRLEGKSLKQELEMFRRSANTYSDMSDARLEQEYYEEYLADQFEIFKTSPKSAKTSSEVKSLFTRILEWIESVFKSYSKNDLNTLFENIDAGKYNSSTIAFNQFTNQAGITLEANALMPYEEVEEETTITEPNGNTKQVIRQGFLYVDNDVAAPLIRSIAGMYLTRASKNSDPNIKKSDILNDVMDDFYVLYNSASPQYANRPEREIELLDQVSIALDEFPDTIKNQVYSFLNVIDNQAAEEEYNQETMEDSIGLRGIDEWGKDASMIGGIQSTPKMIRSYIATTTKQATDYFGNAELTAGEPIITPVDYIDVYNGLLKSVKNIDNPRIMLQNMYFFGLENLETGAVVTKLLNSIGVSEQSLLENTPLPLVIKNPQLFQAFTKAFENFKVDYLFTQRDNAGNILMYSAAQRDDINSQIDSWSQAWTQVEKVLKSNPAVKEKTVNFLDYMQSMLGSNKKIINEDSVKVSNKNISEEDMSDRALSELSAEFQKDFSDLLGIKLSRQFISYSILFGKPDTVLTVKQRALLSSNKSESPLLKESVTEMFLAIQRGSDIYSDGKFGLISRLRKIAQKNAPFDETVGVSVFRNAEGKLVYAHQKPTFHLKAIERLNDVEELNRLKTENPYLEKNYLLNNEAFIKLSSENRQKILRFAGTAVGQLNQSEEEINASISGLIKRETYGNFTPQEFALTLINSYTALVNTKSGRLDSFVEYINQFDEEVKVALAPSLLRVLESSNTGDMSYMPVLRAVETKNGVTNITDATLNIFVDSIETEFDRIVRERNTEGRRTARSVIGYNIEGTDEKGNALPARAFKLHNSATLLIDTVKTQLEEIANRGNVTLDQALDEINMTRADLKLDLNSLLESQFDQFKQELANLNISEELSNSIKNGLDVANNFAEAAELLNLIDNADHNLKQIFFNDWVNTKSLNEVLLGDQAVTLKNGVDAIKRAKAQNAATVSAYSAIIAPELGINHTNEKISSFVLDEPIGKSSLGENKDIEEADAQLYYTTKGFRYSEFGFGKLTPLQAALLDEIENDGQVFIDPLKYQNPAELKSRKKITSEEIFGSNGYANNGSMINSRKLVYADGRTFIKMSAFVLLPQLTSDNIETDPTKPPIWVAKPNMIKLHNLRIKLEAEEQENNSIAIAAPMSAFKMLKQDVTDLSELGNSDRFTNKPTDLSAKNLGLQVEMPSNKKEIIDPTQIKNIITSEQSDDVFVEALGLTVGQIRKEYNKATGRRVEFKFKNKRNLVYTFKKQNGTIGLMDELNISRRTNRITPNLTAFLKYAEEGLKASDTSSNLLEFFATENGEQKYDLNNPITINKFEGLFLTYLSKGVLSEKLPGHSLALVSDFGVGVYRKVYSFDENGIPDRSEIIRENVWKNMKNKPSIQEPSNGLDTTAEPTWSQVEIPKDGFVVIQDRLRSGVKAYDSKGKETGERYTEMLMPAHFQSIMDLIENSNEPMPEVISKLFAIRIPSQDNHSTVNAKYVDFLPAIYGSVAMFARELVEISGADFDIDKVYAQIKQWYVKNNKFIEYGKGKTLDEQYNDYIEYVKENVNKSGSIYNDALKLYNNDQQAIKVSNSSAIKAIKDLGRSYEDAITSLEMLGLPISKEQYSTYVKERGEPYEAALNNKILDYKYALMGNRGVTESKTGETPISYTPAALDILEDEWKVLQEITKLENETSPLTERSREDNIDIDNILGKIKAFRANKGAAIGAIVLPNQYLSLLTEYGIKLNDKAPIFKIDGVIYNDFGVLREKLSDGTLGLRKQDIISSLITMATDNAKERLVAKLGLNKSALGLVANLTALGVPIATSLLLVNNPVIQSIYSEALNKKNKMDPGVKALVAAQLEELNPNGDKIKAVPVTTQMLIDAIKNPESIENTVKFSILRMFQSGNTIADFTGNMRAVSNLTQGLGRDMAAINEKANQIDVLFDKKKAIMDLSSIFYSDTWQSKYLEIFNEIRNELLPTTFLTASPEFKSILDNLLVNVNTEGSGYSEETTSKISRDLLSYITIKAFQKKGQNIATLNNDLIYKSDLESIGDLVEKMRNTEMGKDNFFLEAFAVINQYDNPNNNTGLNLLQSNSFRSLNKLQKVDLQTSFAKLYGSVEMRDDALSIINYLMVKDGLQLAYGTLIDAISPFTMNSYLSHIDTANTALRNGSDAKMEEVFGLTMSELTDEFTNGYLTSHVNNALLNTIGSKTEGLTIKDDILSIELNKNPKMADLLYVRYLYAVPGQTPIYETYIRSSKLSNEEKAVFSLVDTYGSNQQNGIGFMFGERPTYKEVRNTVYNKNTGKDFSKEDNFALNDNNSNSGTQELLEQQLEEVLKNADVNAVVGVTGTKILLDGNTPTELKDKIKAPTRSLEMPKYSVNKNLKNSDGSKRFAQTDGTKITINPLLKGDNKKIFFDYFMGNVPGESSAQKAKVLEQMAKQDWSIDRIANILNSNLAINAFLVLHEQDHIDNNDKEVYWAFEESQVAQFGGKLMDYRNLLTQDKIDIEIRATIAALEKVESNEIKSRSTQQTSEVDVNNNTETNFALQDAKELELELTMEGATDLEAELMADLQSGLGTNAAIENYWDAQIEPFPDKKAKLREQKLYPISKMIKAFEDGGYIFDATDNKTAEEVFIDEINNCIL